MDTGGYSNDIRDTGGAADTEIFGQTVDVLFIRELSRARVPSRWWDHQRVEPHGIYDTSPFLRGLLVTSQQSSR